MPDNALMDHVDGLVSGRFLLLLDGLVRVQGLVSAVDVTFQHFVDEGFVAFG